MFTIKPNSQSFKFLARYNSDFKRLNRAITKEPARVADPYDTLWWDIPKTFCDYYKLVINHIFQLFVIGWLIVLPFLGIWFIVDSWTQACFFANISLLAVIALAGFIIDCLAAIVAVGAIFVGAGMFIVEKIQDKMESREPKNRQPSVIKTAFKAWKEKFCPIMTYNLVKDNQNVIQDQ